MVLPVGGELAGKSVVSGKSVDSGFNQNKSELGVLVLVVSVQMLADGYSLLDKHVQILGDLRGKTVLLQQTEDLVAGDALDLGDTVRVSEQDTNLRRGQTLLGELAHVVLNLGRGGLQPGRRGSLVRKRGLGNALTVRMHTTHLYYKQSKQEIKQLSKQIGKEEIRYLP